MCEAKWIIVIIRVTAAIVVIMCTTIYFTSGGSNEVDLGDDNDVSKINISNGIHLLEVDNSNSNGWSWLEIGFVVLAHKTFCECVTGSRCFIGQKNGKTSSS